MNNVKVFFPKFVQVGLYLGGGRIYWGGRLIFGLLIGFHIWGHM